ncbi:MAG TPA: ComEA family DNA-binding protein [Candidatus Blautia faecipullorum]|nr:ComEA family DNA-binding protein [Candidatus Blautia faecipullorum]
MPPDSRVFQAVEMAGGFLPEAAGVYINQAQPLSDGQQIYVPTEEEVLEKELSVPAAETADSGDKRSGGAEEDSGQEKVNLNTADSAALQTLSGIGEAKAEAILAYREEHGGFSSIEEIMNVPGIKESTFSNIKDKIAVE